MNQERIFHKPNIPESDKKGGAEFKPSFDTTVALLINVPVEFQQGPVPDGEEPPFGLGRIATATTEYFGYNTAILDAHRIRDGTGKSLQIDEIQRQLEIAKPELVGINPTSVNVNIAREIAALLNEMDIPYVLGGYHATLDWETAKEQFSSATAIVRGNGELAFGQIIQAIEMGADVEEIQGVYKPAGNKSGVEYAEKIPPEQLPHLDQQLYFHHPIEEYTDSVTGREVREVSLYETEGCPYACGFCSSPVMTRREYNRPSMERIVDDVEAVLEIGANRIHFLDDLLLIKPDHVNQFYSLLNERGLLGKFDWRGMSRANIISNKSMWTDAVLEKLKDSGCYQMDMALKSCTT